ncbi:anhydro-N-acetylmuramic acid kinase [Xylanivirga thermophila]|uniref:anhydro-N-acetylmuramic acid kinase n=1 Tax=Xylanivirga thermophila TaxID=2496273 RepID=UPI00101C4966|nr:anhydro-N-acetylmuramic acid kinase [Xylanivirga thermophila]
MHKLIRVLKKDIKLVVGLMSGTSVDGVDAALVKIHGNGMDTKTEMIAFKNYPYDEQVRKRIFELFVPETSTVDKVCHMNFLLGEIFARAALDIIAEAGYTPEDIDIIGSHGQTIYHMPNPIDDSGYNVRSTLQIGESAVIAERTGIITVDDFRVRDMAAGGQGAPLVPYTEYMIYRDKNKNIALQNIGGISNVTVIPVNCSMDEVFAFDNGPGNMVIDEVVKRITNGNQNYDKDGQMAGKGTINGMLLDYLMDDKFFRLPLPKTTGREYFGSAYVDRLMNRARELNIEREDLVATVTALTAKSIADSYKYYILDKYRLDRVIIGGGGSYNKTLLKFIKGYLKNIEVITQENLGFSSDAKEAVAFAILANEAINGYANNIPKVTGAKKPVVMGKIVI